MQRHGAANETSTDGGRTAQFEMRDMRIEQEEADSQDAPLIERHDGDERVGYGAERPLESREHSIIFIWALSSASGMSGLLFGFDTGVISSTLVSIGADLSRRNLTTLDKSLITACTSLFAFFASPIFGVLADKIGRKGMILFADALFVVGALWQAASTTVWSMIIGRCTVGFAIGGASLIAPMYIAELAPGHLRGRLVTILVGFITGGQVVAYLIGWVFSTLPAGWRWMVGLGALPAIVQLVLIACMPESPRWLAKADRERRSQESSHCSVRSVKQRSAASRAHNTGHQA